MVKKIAILGSGASGLAAIKCCLEEGLYPVCFERSIEIGGLWHYKQTADGRQARVMKSTVMNFSKEMVAFSDFPVPADYPNYMHNTKMFEYLKAYACHNNLEQYIKFKTNVFRITKTKDFNITGKWELQVQYLDSQNTETEIYDAICVCTGLHAGKSIPHFEGDTKFRGSRVHTQDYSDYHGYEDQRILVIGIGNSGGDIAVELSRVTKQVYISSRHGAWVMNRIGDNGLPRDLELSRYAAAKKSLLGKWYVNKIEEKKLKYKFEHDVFGLKPNHRYSDKIPLVNDDLANRIMNGSIIIKPDIQCFHENGVQFVDGSVINDIDTVIYATGYEIGFPMLENKIIDLKENQFRLYKYVFPVDLEKPSLAVIGCVEPWGSVIPVAELQCRWAARIFKGVNTYPTNAEILDDINQKLKQIAHSKKSSPRYHMQVDWLGYMDEIAEQVGCKPRIGHLVRFDPILALKVYFGPCTPNQYRLHGPGQWDGARDAIMSTMDRVYKPLKRRCFDEGSKITDTYVLLIMCFIILVAIFTFLM